MADYDYIIARTRIIDYYATGSGTSPAVSRLVLRELERMGASPAFTLDQTLFFLTEHVLTPGLVPGRRREGIRAAVARAFNEERRSEFQAAMDLERKLFADEIAALHQEIAHKDRELQEKDALISMERLGRQNAIWLGAQYADELERVHKRAREEREQDRLDDLLDF